MGRLLLRQHVYEHVLRLVVTGQLSPGEKILEERLSKELEVSRTPIREALRLLESDGYLQVEARRGASVSSISEQGVKDLYDLVSALEGRAIFLASPLLGEAELKKLAELNRNLRQIVTKGDAIKFHEINRTFHLIALQACPNSLLLEQITRFRNRVARFRLISLSAPGRMHRSVEEHEAIIGALVEGKAARARHLHERHVLKGGECVARILREVRSPSGQLKRA
jgi:DNA-binding GntR family transcriptional regulator